LVPALVRRRRRAYAPIGAAPLPDGDDP